MFFGDMSIFHNATAGQVIKKRAAPLAGDCVLCGAVHVDEVCVACDRSLQRVCDACPVCALPGTGSQRCGACLAHEPAYDAALAAFAYRFPLERLVHRFKYAGDLAVGRWLALQLAAHVEATPRVDAIVVPPATRARLRERGFNPAAELAKVVAARCGTRLHLDMVRRKREQAPQAGLARRERLANLRGAFGCDAALHGMRVAIVDDVMTTGATAEAVAAVLKRAGASHVRVWALARTPEPGR